MTIDLACPGCGKSYSLPESQRGKRARCKRCGEEFRIDRPEPELLVPEPPKFAYTEPAISLTKPPPPPMMAPPPPPSLRPAEPVVIYPKPAASRAVLPESIPVECPHCGHRYDVETALGGKRARCKSCREVFRLPEAAAVVPTPAAPVARVAQAVPVAQAIPAPAWDAGAPVFKTGWSWSWAIPPGGLGPLRVGLIAVGSCVAVVGIGMLIRGLTHGNAPKKPPKEAPPAVAGRPNGGRPAVPSPAPAGGPGVLDPFPDEPPAPTVRDDVLRRHRASFQGLADASERLIALLRTIDGPPDEATLGKKQAIEATVADLTSARARMPRMNPAEEYRVLAEFAARLIDLGARQKAEIRRLLAKLPADAFATELRRQSSRIDSAIASIRAGMARGPGAVPCVDVILRDVNDPDGLLGEAIRGRLETMTDTAPPEVFRFRSAGGGTSPGFAVRLGPVSDPQAFARKIGFGKPTVKGRKITVADVRADPDDLADARSARDRP